MKKLTAFILFTCIVTAFAFAETEYENYVIITHEKNFEILQEEFNISAQSNGVSLLNKLISVDYTSISGDKKIKEIDFDKVKSFTFKRREITSVKGLEDTKSFYAYIDKHANLRLKSEKPLEQIYIYDAQGSIVYQSVLNDNEASIDFSIIPHGLYIIRSGSEHIKIIK